MNILQVLSQFEVTGAETFAATLADTQIANGHKVFIISDNFYTKTNAIVIAHPIGKRDLKQRRDNITFLMNFIKENNIDIVHAHSRAASWVSYFATRFGDVPLVSSIHGRQHLHFSSKIYSIYGEKRVAVCKSIYTHLNHELNYPLDTLSLVHNGIDLTKWEFQKHNPPKREKKIVSFVGRLSGFKGDTLLIIVEKIFPEIFKRYKNVEFHIIGGMNEKSKIIPAIENTNKLVGTEFIIAKGFSSDVETIYRGSDLIVGSGRVAMEALACGSPVVSIGESNYVGIISESTKDVALVTNFGDLDARHPIDVEQSVRSIVNALEHPENMSGEWGRRFIEENFEINAVSAQLDAVYTEAIAKKKGINEIPVLSYQRITTETGGERVLNTNEFELQLQYLNAKQFTTLNFFDLQEITTFKKHLPAKPIILTFEGYEDNFKNAVPLLKKHGFTGIFFMQTNGISSDGFPFMSFDQVRSLSADGFEIGSASHSRPKMNLISEVEQRKEIVESKTILEQELKTNIISFAYPYGYVSEKIKQIVHETGYRFGAAIDEGRRNIWLDLLKIKRIQIFHGSPKFSFWKKTSGRYHWYKNVY
ncbi:MAG: polysaccharide deacetylase family protein [Bacteroidota bacterium]|nr:polysaccharide deacetylase family protein [Bacteroidota bacterium]